LWEKLRLPYVVAAQLSEPIKTLLRGDMNLQPAVERSSPGGK
jgi:hypothetical protein